MSACYRKSDTVVERTIRGCLILVPMKTGPSRLDALYTLNETSGFIWNAIAPGMSDDDIAARLVKEYDVSEETARADVKRVLGELAAIGAIQSAPGAG